MKAIAFTILVLLVVYSFSFRVEPHNSHTYFERDDTLKQEAIFDILRYVLQNDEHTKYYKDAKTWNFEDNFDKFENVEAVKEFIHYFEHGMLQKDEVFSIAYEQHRIWAISLFNVFYYAKDWTTYYRSIVWAKYNVNPDMFVYALTVSFMHRPDIEGIELPAPFEICPYYFFNADVIDEAQEYKTKNFTGHKKIEGIHQIIIPINYTGKFMHSTDEENLSYFTEDIGLNSYYYYFHADYPFWMGGKEFELHKDRRGELYLFEHQQLLARYYMERLSNHLGAIPELSYFNEVKPGYYPNLRYYNGAIFPNRENNYNFYEESNYYDIMEIEDYEASIRNAINNGFVTLPYGTSIDLTKSESIEHLGNMIQGNPDWARWRNHKYVSLYANILLGSTVERVPDKNKINYSKSTPSALELFETATRDPLFYIIYKRMIKYYWKFNNNLPKYKNDEIIFKGVRIESVEIDKLVTFFNKYDADITNVVLNGFVEEKHSKEDFVIKARTTRLNHLPFNFTLHVSSMNTEKSVVRVFIGPRYDEFGEELDLNDLRENFWLLDVFTYDLQSGKNIIKRNSTEFSNFRNDRTPFYVLRQEIKDALNGGRKYGADMQEARCSFPDRLMLPKGWKTGMPIQFFFYIGPYNAPENEQFSTFNELISCGVGSGSRYIDSLPFNYPLDREISESDWNTPNMYYYDTMIFHKHEQDL